MNSRFDEDRYTYSPDAIRGTIPAGSVTSLDFKISRANMWLSGGKIVYRNASFGDFLQFQVVDKDNILGYGENFILNQFINKWFIDPSATSEIVSPVYAAELRFNNIYLRCIYTSTGSQDVDLCINYDLHHF